MKDKPLKLENIKKVFGDDYVCHYFKKPFYDRKTHHKFNTMYFSKSRNNFTNVQAASLFDKVMFIHGYVLLTNKRFK